MNAELEKWVYKNEGLAGEFSSGLSVVPSYKLIALKLIDLFDGKVLVPVDGYQIAPGSECSKEIVVTAPDGKQQIFWPDDAAYGLMQSMLSASQEQVSATAREVGE